MNYRERCYKAYVTKHFSFTHTLSKNEYDFARKIYAKKFKLFLPSNKDSAIIDVACGAGHFLRHVVRTLFLQKFPRLSERVSNQRSTGNTGTR